MKYKVNKPFTEKGIFYESGQEIELDSERATQLADLLEQAKPKHKERKPAKNKVLRKKKTK